MKISASIYSNGSRALADLVKELDDCGIDCFHVDCNDDPAVFNDIETIRGISKLPVDLHVITAEPDKYFGAIRETGVEMVTFQHENLNSGVRFPADLPGELGIAIGGDTSLDAFANYDNADFVLFTGSTPGVSGGKFDSQTFRRIRDFVLRYPGKQIHVDGGVNHEISFILRNMGVRAVVSGSFLVNSDSIPRALLNLRHEEVESHFHVRDFMLLPDELPILRENEVGLERILKTIEKYAMGFVLVVDDAGKLAGLVTNADVRRGLLTHMSDLNKIEANSIINRTPKTLNENLTVREMLSNIRRMNFPVLYLPVINDANDLTGAIKFNNLIKGES